jgi:hypothetical protein
MSLKMNLTIPWTRRSISLSWIRFRKTMNFSRPMSNLKSKYPSKLKSSQA